MPEYVVVGVRSFIAFCTLLLMARLMGKTQVSQLTFFDYIVGITIGSITASLSIQTERKMTTVVAGVLIWAVLKILVDYISLKSIPARKILEGEPTVVVKNGKIMEDAMARARYDIEELDAQLRNLKVFDLSQVEEAVLEIDGKLSVLQKSQYQPVTPKDLNIPTKYQGMPQVLVVDGRIAQHRLKEVGLTEDWLKQQLEGLGVSDISEIMVAQLNTQGKLYVDKKSDWEGWNF